MTRKHVAHIIRDMLTPQQPLLASQVMEAQREFGRRLTSRMTAQKLTPAMIEERTLDGVIKRQLVRGIGRGNVYGYMKGKHLPTEDTLKALAYALRCSPEDLLPAHYPRTAVKGRRPVKRNVATITAHTVGGFGQMRLQVDMVLPQSTAVGLYRLLVEYARKVGLEVDPPTTIDQAPLGLQETAQVLRELAQPARSSTHQEPAAMGGKSITATERGNSR